MCIRVQILRKYRDHTLILSPLLIFLIKKYENLAVSVKMCVVSYGNLALLPKEIRLVFIINVKYVPFGNSSCNMNILAQILTIL